MAHGHAGLRPRLCIDLYDATCADELPSAQNIYNELKPLVGFIVAGELATTVKVGQELRGAGIGGSRRPLLPLGDGSRAALKKLLTYVQ